MARPRLNIDISRDRLDRLNRRVPHGLRGLLIAALLDLVLDSIEKDGRATISYILDGRFKLVKDDDNRQDS